MPRKITETESSHARTGAHVMVIQREPYDGTERDSLRKVDLFELAKGAGADHYLNFGFLHDVLHDDTAEMITDNTTLEARYLNGFSTTTVPVRAGEKYIVQGFGGTIYNPVFASDTAPLMVLELGELTEAPEGATQLIANGRPGAGLPISIQRYESNASSEAFFEDYARVKESALSGVQLKRKIGVSFAENGECRIFQHGFDDGYDLETLITIKDGNELPDIYGFYAAANDGDEPLVETDLNETVITQSGTDFLSPSTLYAVEDMDGDFPDMTSGKITGGWHRYNSSTTAGTATARNVIYRVFCDGKPVARGSSMRGSRVLVEIVNRLQASNTEKADGSGREVVEQHFRLIFDDSEFGCRVEGTISALEAVHYEMYYGISTYFTADSGVYFVGSRAARGAQTVTAANRCGDKYCTGARQIADGYTLEIGFDPTLDLGTQHANGWAHSCIMSSRKAYCVLIFANGDDAKRLALQAGDKAYWAGHYKVYPTIKESE